MRNLKLMTDYNCYALWDEDEIDNVNVDSLPVSVELKSRIHRWEDAYDATLNQNDPASSGFTTLDELHRFDEEGMELWRCLRRELGRECIIRYLSSRSQVILDPW